MKRILALLMAALICLGLCACGDDGGSAYVPTGGGLTWDDPTHATVPPSTEAIDRELSMVYTPSASYNPYLTIDANNRAWMSLIYQGLFSVNGSYQAYPILCGSYWMSQDMQTYIFYLRSDARFSDGTAVTLSDAEASLRYAMNSPMYGGRFNHVKAMYVSGSGIVFELDTPYENFPILLDVPILKQTELEATMPLGSGPYRLDFVTGGGRLVRVNTWWANAKLPVNASMVSLTVAGDPVEVRDSFEFGGVDLVCADPSDPDYAMFRCDYELWDCENGTFLYLAANLSSSVFGKESVRSALTRAIDRDTIVEDFYHGYARSATLAASPLSPYYNNTLASKYSYNPELLKNAIAAEGLTGTQVKLLVDSSDPQRVRIAKRLVTALTEAGLDVKLSQYTGDEYRYVLNIRNYDLHLGQTRLSPTMDLSAFFSSKGALSFGGMSSAKLANLSLDSLANRGNYYTLLKAVADDGRLCPILFETYAVYGERGAVSNLYPARDNVFCYDLGISLSEILITEAPGYTPPVEE